MTPFVIGGAAVAVALFIWMRLERLLRAKVERELAVAERRVALEEARQARPAPEVTIPTGLLLLANRETEPWAQEHVKRRMRELYVETQDWGMVGQLITQELHGASGGIES